MVLWLWIQSDELASLFWYHQDEERIWNSGYEQKRRQANSPPLWCNKYWRIKFTPIVALQTCVQASLCPIMIVTWSGSYDLYLENNYNLVFTNDEHWWWNLIVYWQYLHDYHHLPVLFEVYVRVSLHGPVKETMMLWDVDQKVITIQWLLYRLFHQNSNWINQWYEVNIKPISSKVVHLISLQAWEGSCLEVEPDTAKL